MKQFLEAYGYTVWTAGDGELAIELVEELLKIDNTIHLLITDLMMPGMTGRRLYEQLRQEIPALKVIFMSGGHDDQVLKDQVAKGEVAFLHKPFSLESLTVMIKGVLSPTQ